MSTADPIRPQPANSHTRHDSVDSLRKSFGHSPSPSSSQIQLDAFPSTSTTSTSTSTTSTSTVSSISSTTSNNTSTSNSTTSTADATPSTSMNGVNHDSVTSSSHMSTSSASASTSAPSSLISTSPTTSTSASATDDRSSSSFPSTSLSPQLSGRSSPGGTPRGRLHSASSRQALHLSPTIHGHSLPHHPHSHLRSTSPTKRGHHHSHSMSHDVTPMTSSSPTLTHVTSGSQPSSPKLSHRRPTFDIVVTNMTSGRLSSASFSHQSLSPRGSGNKNKPTNNPLPQTPTTKVRLSMSGSRPVRSLTAVDRQSSRAHQRLNSIDLNVMDGAHLDRKSHHVDEEHHPDGGAAFPQDVQQEDDNDIDATTPRIYHHVKTRSRTSLPAKAPSPHHSPSASRSLRSLKFEGATSLRDIPRAPDSARGGDSEFNTFTLDSPLKLSIDQKEELDSGASSPCISAATSPTSTNGRLSHETTLRRNASIREERDGEDETTSPPSDTNDNIIAQITANNTNITPQSHHHHGGTIHDIIYENRLAGIFRTSDEESVATEASSLDSSRPKKKQVIFNLDLITKLDPDDDNIIRSTSDIEKFRPRRDEKGNIKSILKRNAKSETVEEAMERIFAEREAESRLLNLLNTGALLIKYNQNGKPNYRWFSVNDDGAELHWQKPGKNGRAPTNKKKASNKKKWPQFKIANWKINADRRRCLVDVLGVHYGPYNSPLFRRYVEMRDGSSGKPWLCITIEFTDRTIDIVCPDDKSVTNWFLGIQSLAPMSVHYLTKGAVLWQRLIMKLNFYGLGGLQEANARERQQMLTQQQQQQQQITSGPASAR